MPCGNSLLGYAIRLSADRQATTGNMADDLVDRLRTKQSGALYWNEHNGKLYQILVETFRGTICAPYIKMFAKAKDGRAAYLQLRSQYLGKDSVNAMAAAAEAALSKLSFSGQVRNWDFDKFCSRHIEIWNTLEELTQFGYNNLDPQLRKRKFLAGITDKKLEAPKHKCQSDGTMTFDQAASFGLVWKLRPLLG